MEGGELGQVGRGQPARMNGAGDECAVATRVPHPLEVPPGEDPTTRQKPDVRETSSQRLQQPDVHSASCPDSTEVQQQERRDPGRDSLGGQAQGIRTHAAGILHGGMKNGIAQPEVETEYQPRWADHAGRWRRDRQRPGESPGPRRPRWRHRRALRARRRAGWCRRQPAARRRTRYGTRPARRISARWSAPPWIASRSAT